MPLALLVLLFAMFVAVQLTVLFGGSRHVLDTDGLTYADYARGGFWQLLVVTGLTLLVLAGAARWAPRDDPHRPGADPGRSSARWPSLTLVIVASALHRMDVYADTYGLTRLRLLVALCELWLGWCSCWCWSPASGCGPPGCPGRWSRRACWRCSAWPRPTRTG